VATRQYAKRQMTWFRHEAGIHWLEGFGDDPRVQHQVIQFLRDAGLAAGSPRGSVSQRVP
jgi:tRNA A37 N6-isopentenylltransferase MiaA